MRSSKRELCNVTMESAWSCCLLLCKNEYRKNGQRKKRATTLTRSSTSGSGQWKPSKALSRNLITSNYPLSHRFNRSTEHCAISFNPIFPAQTRAQLFIEFFFFSSHIRKNSKCVVKIHFFQLRKEDDYVVLYEEKNLSHSLTLLFN
jgi:hypothetical protein